MLQESERRRAEAASELAGPRGEGRWRALHADVTARANLLVASLAALFVLGPQGAPISLPQPEPEQEPEPGASPDQAVLSGGGVVGSAAAGGNSRASHAVPGPAAAPAASLAPAWARLFGGRPVTARPPAAAGLLAGSLPVNTPAGPLAPAPIAQPTSSAAAATAAAALAALQKGQQAVAQLDRLALQAAAAGKAGAAAGYGTGPRASANGGGTTPRAALGRPSFGYSHSSSGGGGLGPLAAAAGGAGGGGGGAWGHRSLGEALQPTPLMDQIDAMWGGAAGLDELDLEGIDVGGGGLSGRSSSMSSMNRWGCACCCGV